MFRRFPTIAVTAAVLVMASCARENLENGYIYNDGLVKFGVELAPASDVSLGVKSGVLSTEDGSISIPLSHATVEGIDAVRMGGSALTKGTQYNSESEMTADVTKLYVAAWNEDGTEFLSDGTEVSYASGKWSLAATTPWSPEGIKTFLTYANLPASGASVVNSMIGETATQTFTYTVPSDARLQNDIMLGWYKGNGGETTTADITMVHPLTAIQFKQGAMDMAVKAIKSISIDGLLKTGEATVTYAIADSKVSPSYSWVPGSETQSVTLSPLGEAPALEVDETTKKIAVPFIVLPQKVAANKVKLSVVLTIGGTDRTLTAYLPADDLEEGITNVFTIGYAPYGEDALPGEFSVSATKKVRFSRGNLYCTRSGQEGNYTYDFAFENHQYDFRTRPDMKQFSDDYVTPIDFSTPSNTSGLFEWDVTKKSSDFGAFGVDPITTGSADDVLDFGEAIGSGWTTLSIDEWSYLLDNNSRANRYAKAVVNGVNGLLLFPDGWINNGGLQGINEPKAAYSVNTIALTGTPSWQDIENQGVIFLPAAGCMANNSPSIHGEAYVGAITTVCDYWSSTAAIATQSAQYLTAAYYAGDETATTVSKSVHRRDYARSVRLVTEVKQPAPKVEFIDLGLPSGTKWADVNVGAVAKTGPGSIGDYYAWGETEPWYSSISGTTLTMKSDYSDGYASTTYSNKSNMKSILHDLTGEYKQYDVAFNKFGDSCRMPSKTDFEELWNNTYQSTETVDGVFCWKFTNKSDVNKYIYLPFGGQCNAKVIENNNNKACYWSSTNKVELAEFLEIEKSSGEDVFHHQSRYFGCTIRAVKEPTVPEGVR